jgi:hypothetical protein
MLVTLPLNDWIQRRPAELEIAGDLNCRKRASQNVRLRVHVWDTSLNVLDLLKFHDRRVKLDAPVT